MLEREEHAQDALSYGHFLCVPAAPAMDVLMGISALTRRTALVFEQ
jgi:hypothetical protein